MNIKLYDNKNQVIFILKLQKYQIFLFFYQLSLKFLIFQLNHENIIKKENN